MQITPIMKKYICLLFVLLTALFLSCKTTKYVENTLCNQYEKDVILKFGMPLSSNLYFVNQDYDFHSEIEPDYSKYLSEEVIKNGIDIKEIYWKQNKKNIYAWGYDDGFGIKIFASIIYSDDIVF